MSVNSYMCCDSFERVAGLFNVHESCHTHAWVMAHGMYEWIMSHIWMSHFTYSNESCHTYEWVVWHIWMSHGTHLNESCGWAMSHMNEPCHIWMRHVTSKCVMSHMNEPCRIWMTHVAYEWVIHTWMSRVKHINQSSSFTHVTCVMSHTWMRHATFMNASCHTNKWVMSHI